MSDVSAKQQIVDKIKSSTNILVTVSNNPSVDELSAALGLSLLLNKMKKHATAVFSGEIPPAITFLDPAKTFENTVDSLRDFIIALDKEKADHLRYKVEGDVVKIFITPYRTTITSDDLDFSQGDYNVELVLALGVQRQDNLDKALEAHGQIFDDATVVTIVAGGGNSDLGSISWREQSASSLSEMMVSLSEAMKTDKTLIDEQIATAFLSGIVAATERFSNSKTSARVMTMAAQLMGAGANQQLIASKFDEADDEDGEGEGKSEDDEQENKDGDETPAPAEPEAPVEGVEDAPTDENAGENQDEAPNSDGTTSLSEGESTKVERDGTSEEETSEEVIPEAPAPAESGGVGTLSISHEKEGTIDEVAQQTAMEDQAEATKAAEAAASAAQPMSAPEEQAAADTLPPVVMPMMPMMPVAPAAVPEDLQKDIEAASAEAEAAAIAPQLQGAVSSEAWQGTSGPTYGGALNATTEAAAEDARKLENGDRNKTILNHNGAYIADQIPTFNAPPLNAASQAPEEQSMVNPLGGPSSPSLMAAPLQPVSPTLTDLDQQNQIPGAPSLPPLPDFSTLPPFPPAPPPPPVSLNLGNGAIPLGQAPPIAPPTPVAQPGDPGQFRIPGQS